MEIEDRRLHERTQLFARRVGRIRQLPPREPFGSQPGVHVEVEQARFGVCDPAQRVGVDTHHLEERVLGKPGGQGERQPLKRRHVLLGGQAARVAETGRFALRHERRVLACVLGDIGQRQTLAHGFSLSVASGSVERSPRSSRGAPRSLRITCLSHGVDWHGVGALRPRRARRRPGRREGCGASRLLGKAGRRRGPATRQAGR